MDSCVRCIHCKQLLTPASVTYLSCGHLLCQSCAPNSSSCPTQDNGQSFTPISTVKVHLEGIITDAVEDYRRRQGELRELLEELKRVRGLRCVICSEEFTGEHCPKCSVPPAAKLPTQRDMQENPPLRSLLEGKTPVIHIPCPYSKPVSPIIPSSVSLQELYTTESDLADQKLLKMTPIRQELERRIQEEYPGCTLLPFGSCCNGFTTSTSDFDLTLKLPNSVSDVSEKCHILTSILTLISRYYPQFSIEDRLSARTPVLKCRYSDYELDLSVDNMVAVSNSNLLHTYSKLDVRVHALGIIIKIWTKCREIADASQGFLSSYSYLVMLIAYLQRTNPPLVPSLQADCYICEREMISGFDCTFEKDLTKYTEMTVSNHTGIGELLLGYFTYYGYEFNWQVCVVTMRLYGVLTKVETRWEGKDMAIEDPFEIDRNLGDVVRKSDIIIQEFRWAAYLLGKGYTFEEICRFSPSHSR